MQTDKYKTYALYTLFVQQLSIADGYLYDLRTDTTTLTDHVPKLHKPQCSATNRDRVLRT